MVGCRLWKNIDEPMNYTALHTQLQVQQKHRDLRFPCGGIEKGIVIFIVNHARFKPANLAL